MENMYFTLYALLQQYIYGADAVLTEHMELTLTLLSTIGSLVVVTIPFFVVFGGLSLIFGFSRWR